MTRLVKVVSLAAAMACGLMGAFSSAQAQSNNDPLSLKIANAISPDRFFIRAGVIGVKVKTKSEDTYDVTGPILTKADLNDVKNGNIIRDYLLAKDSAYYSVLGGSPTNQQTLAQRINDSIATGPYGVNLLIDQMEDVETNAEVLGTPKGLKAVADESMGTAGLSLGYFLDDEYKWTVEAYVLAAPLKTYIAVTSPGSIQTDKDTGEVYVKPLGLEGQKAITTKLLPPTVMLGRYFGDRKSKFRPYVGALAMYAVFYDTKASDALNNYVGGANPGDTTVSIKNKFGLGPMLGLKYSFSDDWHVSLNIGSVKLKTQGTIITRNTVITDATPAIADFGDSPEKQTIDGYNNSISEAISTGIIQYGPGGSLNGALRNGVIREGGIVTMLNRAINYSNTQRLDGNLGTFVRKANSTITNTIFMLSVGRSF